jgi:UDP-N-acetylmuramate-alanine ligase
VFVPRVEELAENLKGLLRADDVVLAMGAGSISAVAHGLSKQLGENAR